MDFSDGGKRGDALWAYLQERLPVGRITTVGALAKQAGVRPTTVSEWRTQGKEPDLDSLRKLAVVIHVPVSDLVAAYEGELAAISEARRAEAAEVVEGAMAPIRALLRDAGLLQADTAPAEVTPRRR